MKAFSFCLALALILAHAYLLPCSLGPSEQHAAACSVEQPALAPPPGIISLLPDTSMSCTGVKVIPLRVENWHDVNTLNLSLHLPAGVNFLGIQNVHPNLGMAPFLASLSGNTLQLGWFSAQAASIGNGILAEILVDAGAGTHLISWDTAQVCHYLNFLQGTLPATWQNGSLSVTACSNLSGYVKYLNPVHSILTKGVTVKLYDGNTQVGVSGLDTLTHQFTFHSLPNGSYRLTAEITLPYGGAGSNDSYSILRHFTGIPPGPLSGFLLQAADVNGDGQVNCIDALAISRRFTGQIPNYSPPYTLPGNPDYTIDELEIVIDGSAHQEKTLYCLCTGDIAPTFFTPPFSIPSTP